MSIAEAVECDIKKMLEGDIAKDRPISECLMRKIAANTNGIAKAWKLDCKELTGNGTWVSPENVFFVAVIAHTITNSFTLNQFAGDPISTAGQSGINFLHDLMPETSYFYQTGGTLSLVCISC